MIPTIAQPLASIAGGATATPPDPGLASAATPTPARARAIPGAAAAAPDAAGSFVAAARGNALLPGAAPSAGSRARSGAAGYASSAPRSSASTSASRSAAGSASTAATSAAAAKKAGPLGFLEDRSLSVEEKLMRLLAYLSDKWDKDIEKKMREMGAGQQKASAPSTEKKKSGPLGSLASIVKTATGFFPAVGLAVEALRNPTVRAALSKVGGPVLAAAATALGYPTLAPLLLKYGPAVIDVAAGVATSLDGGSTSSARASSGAGSSSPASPPSATGMNDSELRLKLMEIERIQNLQKEMFSLVSNILRAGHETRMNVIQNVR